MSPEEDRTRYAVDSEPKHYQLSYSGPLYIVLNPTIEVVTFRLSGWCILGVFSLPAFTRLGHECQDLFSPCNGLDLGLCFHPKEFWGNGVRTHVNSKGKIPSTGGSEEVRTRDAASRRTASPTHYRLHCEFRPPDTGLKGPSARLDYLFLIRPGGSQRGSWRDSGWRGQSWCSLYYSAATRRQLWTAVPDQLSMVERRHFCSRNDSQEGAVVQSVTSYSLCFLARDVLNTDVLASQVLALPLCFPTPASDIQSSTLEVRAVVQRVMSYIVSAS